MHRRTLCLPLVEKPFGKQLLGKLKGMENKIKIIFKETGCEDERWI
jgi:hypothetical protein